MKHLFKDEKVISTLATLFAHVILILLFLAIRVDFRPIIPEFVEVSFASPAPQPLHDIPSEAEEIGGNFPEAEERISSIAEKNLKKIELPERRELQMEEEKIVEKVQPQPEKKLENAPVPTKNKPTNLPRMRTKVSDIPFAKKEKPVSSELFSRQMEQKELPGASEIAVSAEENFEIDWEGDIQREIYQKRLPEFPPDIQREATIRIRFSVLPNGLVGSAILLQKGETRLENLTLETFRTWRFNPLPDYVDQKAQTGVITFRFKLK